jgi:hypothetical protein
MAGDGTPGISSEVIHPGPRVGKYPSRRRQLLGRVVSVGCAITILVLASPWLLAIPYFYDHQPMWPGGSSTFTMVGSTTSNGLSVPNCALVSVSWTDLAGRVIGFGAWQGGEAVLISSCSDVHIPLAPATPPSECPPASCVPGRASAGPGPMSYQTSSSGRFQFVQTQGDFGFWANVEGTNSTSEDPISIHYSYSVPVFSVGAPPPGSASPTFAPIEWVFLTPFVGAGWILLIRLLRRERLRLPPRQEPG